LSSDETLYRSQSTNAGSLGLSGSPQIGPKLNPCSCNACELHATITVILVDSKKSQTIIFIFNGPGMILRNIFCGCPFFPGGQNLLSKYVNQSVKNTKLF
jgi:hypothetical protein